MNKEKSNSDSELVCYCLIVTEATIREVVVENQLDSVEEVTDHCGAGGGCGNCHFQIKDLINQIRTPINK